MLLMQASMTLITRTVAQDMIFNVAQHTVPSRDVLTMCGVGLLPTQNYTTDSFVIWLLNAPERTQNY